MPESRLLNWFESQTWQLPLARSIKVAQNNIILHTFENNLFARTAASSEMVKQATLKVELRCGFRSRDLSTQPEQRPINLDAANGLSSWSFSNISRRDNSPSSDTSVRLFLGMSKHPQNPDRELMTD